MCTYMVLIASFNCILYFHKTSIFALFSVPTFWKIFYCLIYSKYLLLKSKIMISNNVEERWLNSLEKFESVRSPEWKMKPGIPTAVKCIVRKVSSRVSIYLLYGTTALEELWPHSNEGFFIWFNFSYTYFLLEAERPLQ